MDWIWICLIDALLLLALLGKRARKRGKGARAQDAAIWPASTLPGSDQLVGVHEGVTTMQSSAPILPQVEGDPPPDPARSEASGSSPQGYEEFCRGLDLHAWMSRASGFSFREQEHLWQLSLRSQHEIEQIRKRAAAESDGGGE